ncbi:MAG: biotin-dependent carboxyltransferase family protein [Bacillota bacterium]|nr:biotin-dependent carboxyltransferase family protein [Bacillota bacterium]
MCIEVKSGGLLTTVQDLGRYGLRKYGVIVSGVMDEFAHRIANILVGNEETAATLEITLVGPELFIKADTLISICGADLSPSIDGSEVPMWRSIYVMAGSVLSFGKCKSGARCYIAFAGSFDTREIMKSKSTYLRAGIGGYEGRALKKGDKLKLNVPKGIALKMASHLVREKTYKAFFASRWFVGEKIMPRYESNAEIRVTKGVQFQYFNAASKKNFFKCTYSVSTQSDRMGYRLNGDKLSKEKNLEMLSEGVALGTIQVPSDGNPIILLADRQTTGGYPKIGEVISVDIPIVAQLKPGDTIAFKETSLEEAQRLYILREMNFRTIINAIKMSLERL